MFFFIFPFCPATSILTCISKDLIFCIWCKKKQKIKKYIMQMNAGQTISFIFISKTPLQVIQVKLLFWILHETTVQKHKTNCTYALHVYIKSENFADFHRTFFADFSFICTEFYIFLNFFVFILFSYNKCTADIKTSKHRISYIAYIFPYLPSY